MYLFFSFGLLFIDVISASRYYFHMLPYLNLTSPFPPVDEALDEPNGLLAAGGDLSKKRLLSAYQNGIFPWYSEDDPILWWSPDPRTVFFIDHFKVSRSVKRSLKKGELSVTLNKAFSQVVTECALPRSDENGTWITEEMKAAYIELHKINKAHSVEVWQGCQLVGGIYGVAAGKVFCGESMFSKVSNGSKIALTCLAKFLQLHEFKLIDCQIENPHLIQLGATNIARELYIDLLKANLSSSETNISWKPCDLNWHDLLFK